MNVLDEIEDAFLTALEQGATPPAEFRIRIPWQAWLAVGSTPLRVAGFVIHLDAGGPSDSPAIWRH